MDAMPQVDEADLDALDTYLGSVDAAGDCMLLSELDGFMTGVVLAPRPVAEAEWIPVAFGARPCFASPEQRERILDIVRRRAAFVEATLRQDPDEYAPIFWTDEMGQPLADDWANGFRRAISLREAEWTPLIRSEEDNVLLAPIAALWDGVLDDDGVVDPDIAEAAAMAPDLIPAAVIGIFRYWYRRGRPADA